MEKKRDGFKSRTGFVIACIGSAVGMEIFGDFLIWCQTGEV